MAKKIFTCSDGQKLSYNLWLPEEKDNVKAFIQILHGMAEYSDRYDKFAKYLNSLGFAVFAADHRGHGDTSKNGTLGWFAEEDGWNRIAQDAYELADSITTKYNASSLILFGHSMGSFLARTLIVQHPDFYNGVIIMGTGCSKGLVGKIGKLLCKMKIKTEGQKSPGITMNKMSFGAYNKAFEPAITEYDWLSRDQKEVDKYVKDPLCGFICTNGFFYDLLTGLEFANSKKNAQSLPKDLPMLIISGSEDPVGDNSKGVQKVYNLYKNVGITNLTLHLVEGARHELLNETDRLKTYKYLSNWIEKRV